mmetsp:Transcript_5272/g.14149  ORF Transcript_5272/g.14149 Transcript_5272/m.14149 type:complete len:163 (+) Transcript_5272:520-1008(+)
MMRNPAEIPFLPQNIVHKGQRLLETRVRATAMTARAIHVPTRTCNVSARHYMKIEEVARKVHRFTRDVSFASDTNRFRPTTFHLVTAELGAPKAKAIPDQTIAKGMCRKVLLAILIRETNWKTDSLVREADRDPYLQELSEIENGHPLQNLAFLHGSSTYCS